MIIATADACPISGATIDASAARVNGMLVTALLAVALLTPARWVLFVVLLDFTLKLVVGFRLSPLCFIARHVSAWLKLPPRFVDIAPKRFAAGSGATFCIAGILSGIVLDAQLAYYVFVGMFAACAALEGIAGVCMGCRIYALLPRRA